MKFTLSWLKDHLETDATLAEISEALTAVGLEVEEIFDPAERLKAFKVAYVVEASQHPNADRLRVCKVDAGEGIVQVVCGAPNARTGMKGVFAPAGTYVPGTDLLLKPTKIRGVESSGMLCSARELELGDDHDGIIELSETAEIGTPVAAVLGADDPMIEIAITPNRPDCLGVYGIARDLAAAGLGRLKAPGADQGVSPIAGAFASPVPIELDFAEGAKNACPVFAGRVVIGVRNGASPDWLQARLRAIGLRPINALVDVTNYISYDRGRPLHVYDMEKVRGRIIARLGKKGETLEALDGKTYEIDEEMCVIADESGAIGLGGVMGGENTGSTETTTNVLIECAYFDPLRTARTGRVLNLNSDARYRFERGVDPAFVEPGLELATQMVLDLCGGEASEAIVAGEAPVSQQHLVFEPGEVKRLTGVDVPRPESLRILTALGFQTTEHEDRIEVAVPTWRPDIGGPTDLVEEVIRIYGLDNVEPVPMSSPAVSAPSLATPMQSRARRARRAGAARGLMETMNWSFIPQPHAELFGAPQGGGALRLANPISQDMSTMRPGLLPGLLVAAQRNADRGEKTGALFEVGHAFSGDQSSDQHLIAAGVRWGASPRHWRDASEAPDAFVAKADTLALLRAAGFAGEPQVASETPDWYHPGRSGTLRLGPKLVLATFGELHPAVLASFDLDGPVVGFEVFLDAIPDPKRKATKSRGPLDASDLMPLERDFAFLVASDIPASDLTRAAAGADKTLIRNVSVFDVYEGKGIEPGTKSIALAVTLQPKEKTLTEADLDAASERIVNAVIKATGGSLRS